MYGTITFHCIIVVCCICFIYLFNTYFNSIQRGGEGDWNAPDTVLASYPKLSWTGRWLQAERATIIALNTD